MTTHHHEHSSVQRYRADLFWEGSKVNLVTIAGARYAAGAVKASGVRSGCLMDSSTAEGAQTPHVSQCLLVCPPA